MKDGLVMKAGVPGQGEMEEINRYTRRPYGPEEVYTFALVLCDNEIDRDYERFALESFLLTVTCQGAWWPAWGVADVEIPKAGRFTGCPVCRAVYHQDSGGARTRFVLERGETDVADGTAGSGAAP